MLVFPNRHVHFSFYGPLRILHRMPAVESTQRKQTVITYKSIHQRVLLFLLIAARASISPCSISLFRASMILSFLFRKSGPDKCMPDVCLRLLKADDNIVHLSSLLHSSAIDHLSEHSFSIVTNQLSSIISPDY